MDAARFRWRRHFAAWIGLTPREHSTPAIRVSAGSADR
ncbi:MULTISPECIES: transposase [unclassified Acidisoma]